MSKRYRKMAKKANRKIREIGDGQVVLEVPLPICLCVARRQGLPVCAGWVKGIEVGSG